VYSSHCILFIFSHLKVNTRAIGATGIVLAGCLGLLILAASVAYAKRQAMGKKFGALLCLMYVAFLVYEFILDQQQELPTEVTR